MTSVTVLTVELLIFESASLKDKRSVVRSVLQRTRNKFGVAAAEVGDQDERMRATLAFAAVSSDAQISRSVSQRVLNFLEQERLDCELGVVSTETLYL